MKKFLSLLIFLLVAVLIWQLFFDNSNNDPNGDFHNDQVTISSPKPFPKFNAEELGYMSESKSKKWLIDNGYKADKASLFDGDGKVDALTITKSLKDGVSVLYHEGKIYVKVDKK